MQGNVKCSAVPWKVDFYGVKRWYLDECAGEVLKDYNKFCKSVTPEEAFSKIKDNYSMIKEKYLRMMCDNNYDPNIYTDI